MASFAMRSIFIILLCCKVFTAGMILNLTLADLQELQVSGREWNLDDKQAEYIALYFDNAASRKLYPNFLKEYELASNALKEFNVQLSKLNCEELKEDLNHCSKDYKKIHVYRRGQLQEEIFLDTIFNEDSIVSHLLQVALNDEVKYINEQRDLDELLESMKNFENVVLGYVKGLGMKEHRYLLENAHVYSLMFTFALTTDEKIATQLGMRKGDDASVWIFLCKPPFPSENITLCKSEQYMWKIKKVSLGRFLQYQHLPKVEVLLDAEDFSAYSDTSLTLSKLYVFHDEVDQSVIKELEEFGGEKQGALGIIYVDAAKHKKLVAKFGIPEESTFPMFVLMPGGPKHNGEHLVEHIHADTYETAKGFVSSWLENPDKEYKNTARDSSLEVVPYKEYSEVVSKRDTEFVLAVLCAHDFPECKAFGQNYRRLVRSLDFPIANRSSVRLVYVELAEQVGDYSSFKLPNVRLHTTPSVENYLPLYGSNSYDGLLKFIKEQTKNNRIPRLPPSGSDRVPIRLPGEEDTSDPYTDIGVGPNEDIPPEELEDSEVTDSVLRQKKNKRKIVNDVPALTDKTFDSTRDASDVVVVHFYVYWEPRCIAFHQPFADAAAKLEQLNAKGVKIARVNCFDWTDVCQKENVTRYPTVKMYRKGSLDMIYKAPLDTKHVVKSALLLLAEAPIFLQSAGETKMFVEGKLPQTADQVTDVAVLGIFHDGNSPGVDVFKAAAQTLHSQFLLGYTTRDVAKREASKLGVSLPVVVLYKRNDALKPREIFNRGLTADSVVQFVQMASLPAFGELTPLNLPLYYAHRKPLVIVFNSKNVEDQYSPVISKIARQSSVADVFFCWIELSSNEVNAAILKAYTDEVKVPTLVAVDHGKGAVYQYTDDVTEKNIEDWVNKCVSGSAKKKSVLKEGNWEPRLEGYDFLRKIEEDEANKKKNSEEKNGEQAEKEEKDEENKDSKIPEEKPRNDKIKWKKETSDKVKQPADQVRKSVDGDAADLGKKEEDEDQEKSDAFQTDEEEDEKVTSSRLRLPQHHGHHDDKNPEHHDGHDEL